MQQRVGNGTDTLFCRTYFYLNSELSKQRGPVILLSD